jgi:hypothetical protein
MFTPEIYNPNPIYIPSLINNMMAVCFSIEKVKKRVIGDENMYILSWAVYKKR